MWALRRCAWAGASMMTYARPLPSSSRGTCPLWGARASALTFGLPIIFGPIHVAFLKMIIEPVCSLVLEAE